ncbi:phosphate ABC transporter permease PstA [Natronosalvus rutilus]|uniref:Phosphate transport system permease protein PstA n=1 Tax=Natronosalvus rutilus TaxID=2953753 RepID=A0A9E7NFP7_9EURY|nr:phosphate ABC transporter permease PstA [Natronosalvus rutilus]UTF55927.1 phosphate ABC transporter permease PstA [Natronosalvus rutilus]
MASEPAGADVVEERETTADVSRLRGRVFKWVSAAATVFGITVVAGLLLYVANDALRPSSADLGWGLTFAATLGLPMVALAAYYLTRDRAAGRVAYETTGVLAVGLITAGGFVILFRELATPVKWLALVVALGVGAGAIIIHARLRPAAALERLVVSILAPLLAVLGVPAISVEHTVALPLSGTKLFAVTFATPRLLPSVRDLVFLIPVLPVDWMLLVGTVTVPVSFAYGRFVVSRRDDGRGRYELVGGTVVVATVVALVAPLVGVTPENGVLLATAVLVPSAAYLEGVVRRDEGLLGLLFPVAVVLGGVAGVAITGTLGFAGPDPWLDWGFLTSATSRNPADAGIYPALVGSVLIVLVIALTAFPVGVGAAIYLEEYAPSSGRLARLVELVEINIGNLAGVPSIVYGLLGLALFVQGIGLRSGIVIVGGLTVGLLILPIVIISAQEAVRAVPDSRRQASYGMGATRWQTTRNVVLPEALPGILTGTILALGRAIGETAPLLMIGIASSVRSPPSGFFSKTGAMPRQIFSWSSEIQPEFRFGVLAAGVIVLVAVLLIMNGTAIVLRNRYQRSN